MRNNLPVIDLSRGLAAQRKSRYRKLTIRRASGYDFPSNQPHRQDPLRLSTAHRSGLLIGKPAREQIEPPLVGQREPIFLTFTPRPERSEAGFLFSTSLNTDPNGSDRRLRPSLST